MSKKKEEAPISEEQMKEEQEIQECVKDLNIVLDKYERDMMSQLVPVKVGDGVVYQIQTYFPKRKVEIIKK